MSSFKNFNSDKNNNNKNNYNISKNIFQEGLNLINNTWDRWDKDITKLKDDSKSLNRMFNDYNKDKRFLELKNNIEKEIEIKKKYLLELENLVLQLKIKIESSRQ
jgi:hypothetical protein